MLVSFQIADGIKGFLDTTGEICPSQEDIVNHQSAFNLTSISQSDASTALPELMETETGVTLAEAVLESAKMALNGTVAGISASPLTLGAGGGETASSIFDETGDPCAQVQFRGVCKS